MTLGDANLHGSLGFKRSARVAAVTKRGLSGRAFSIVKLGEVLFVPRHHFWFQDRRSRTNSSCAIESQSVLAMVVSAGELGMKRVAVRTIGSVFGCTGPAIMAADF